MAWSDQMLDAIFDELFPICRSISGPGLRQSLDIMARYMPLERSQVASGSRVFDWTVPPEWHVRAARLTGPDGRVVADFAANNLHLVNYSEPVDRVLPLAELRGHLHSLPHLPEAVPYVTSYYRRNWGFCLAHAELERLPQGDYHAFVDSAFVDGGVDYAQCRLPGESEREILLSSYLCHPSMANNELSGPLVLLGLYHRIRQWPRRRYSYRFLINPETIGSLCFLHGHHEHLARHLEAGLVLTCLGGPRDSLSYKCSRRGDGLFDRVFARLAAAGHGIEVRPFTPESGSDERQYCSPGFNLPVGNMVRTAYGDYPGYHNSLDDKAFMGIDRLVDAIDRIEQLLELAEVGATYVNCRPYGEPQLGRYDLYPSTNGAHTWTCSSDTLGDGRRRLGLILQTLSHCDGTAPMVELSDRLGVGLAEFAPIVEILERNGLLRHAAGSARCPS
jgi:aminopeptidase-like protein